MFEMFELNQEHDLNEKSGKFHATSLLICPDCSGAVCVGFGGEKNLAFHRTSKACQRKQKKNKAPERQNQPNHDLRAFFKPRHLEIHKRHKGARLEETREAPEMGAPLQVEAGETRKIPCQKGIELLSKLEAATTRIPNNVPLATPAHRLSLFSADPRFCVASPEQGAEVEVESDWDILNSMLKTTFGLGESEMRENVKEMLNRGEHGLDGFIRFFKFFVFERGLEGAMIEPTIEGLLHEIDSRYVPPSKPPSVPQSIAAGTVAWEATTAYLATACETVLKPALATTSGTVDSPIVLDHVSDLASKVVSDTCSDLVVQGIFVEFPHGKNHHTSYPFGLHSERNIPWDYRLTDDKFYIQAKLCRQPLISKGSACEDCRALASTPLYVSIMDRIRNGVHENAPLQLRLTKLNARRKLLGKCDDPDGLADRKDCRSQESGSQGFGLPCWARKSSRAPRAGGTVRAPCGSESEYIVVAAGDSLEESVLQVAGPDTAGATARIRLAVLGEKVVKGAKGRRDGACPVRVRVRDIVIAAGDSLEESILQVASPDTAGTTARIRLAVLGEKVVKGTDGRRNGAGNNVRGGGHTGSAASTANKSADIA
ncbi:hypothetical protein EDB84DRAFT_1463023 [Lactarius hengduanensis]|nr:hypothetical protein EDB84DRAFT_1463023 [Lactarius hengduanensis]